MRLLSFLPYSHILLPPLLQAKKKQEEDEIAQVIQRDLELKRQEKLLKKQKKLQERQAAKEQAWKALEAAVQQDIWSQDEQLKFESALLDYTCSVEKLERWTQVAHQVGSKSKTQCLARYTYLKEIILRRKAQS